MVEQYVSTLQVEACTEFWPRMPVFWPTVGRAVASQLLHSSLHAAARTAAATSLAPPRGRSMLRGGGAGAGRRDPGLELQVPAQGGPLQKVHGMARHGSPKGRRRASTDDDPKDAIGGVGDADADTEAGGGRMRSAVPQRGSVRATRADLYRNCHTDTPLLRGQSTEHADRKSFTPTHSARMKCTPSSHRRSTVLHFLDVYLFPGRYTEK